MREFAHAIHPPVLADQGLLEAIEAQAARLPLEVVIEADPALRGVRYPAHIETTTWYVVAEALTNAVKHARAERVLVALTQPDGHLAVEVRDDGAASTGAPRAASGLAGLADRIAIVHGGLRIDSGRATGTKLHVEIPFPDRRAPTGVGHGPVKGDRGESGDRTWLSRCASSSPTTITWSGRAPGGCSRTRAR